MLFDALPCLSTVVAKTLADLVGTFTKCRTCVVSLVFAVAFQRTDKTRHVITKVCEIAAQRFQFFRGI